MLSNSTLRRIAAKRREEQGFTLVELMVVVLIIGILIAIAIPVFLSARGGANDSKSKADVRSAVTAMTATFAQKNALPTQAEIATELGGATVNALSSNVTSNGVYYAAVSTVGTVVAKNGSNCFKASYDSSTGTITRDSSCTTGTAVGQTW